MKRWTGLLLSIFMAINLLAGCAQPEAAPVSPSESSDPIAVRDEAPKQSSEQTDSEQVTQAENEANEANSEFVEAKITQIVAVNVLKVQIEGKEDTVRLLMIAESESPNELNDEAGVELALEQSDLAGRDVALELDVLERDRDGQLLAYIWLDDKMLNETLLEQGLARFSDDHISQKYVERLKAVEQKAKHDAVGIWHIPTSAPTSTPTTAPTATQAPTPSLSIEPAVQEIEEASVKIISVTSPVRPGANATLKAKVTPGSKASISVYYKSGLSTAAGLIDKTADANGNVSWTWKVGTRTTPGEWRIVVSVNGESETVYFEVAK